MQTLKAEPGSFRDPYGKIFYVDDNILRVARYDGINRINFISKNNLLEKLISQDYLIDSKITNQYDSIIDNIEGKIIIKHKKIPFISYPYEWSFEQLKDAAIHHLDLHLFLLENNATLIDASAYNIQFNINKPIFIDILSIKEYVEGEFWLAHKQFCENFLNPLILKSKKGINFNNWFKGNLDGIKTEEIYSILNIKDFFSYNIFTNIFLMNYFDKKILKEESKKKIDLGKKKLSKVALVSILKQLRSFIKNLNYVKSKTTWDTYSQNNTYKKNEEDEKKKIVTNFILKNKFNHLVDMGCNDGVYSEISLSSGCKLVVGFDYDLNSVENAYIKAKNENLNLLPLYLDAANPSSNLGWNETERKGFKARAKFDGMLALAFEHHLAIAKNIPLEQTLKWLINIAPKGLIEFVPKNDETIKKMLLLKGDIFNDYNEQNFKDIILKKAKIVSEHNVSESGRKIFEYNVL